MKGKKIGCLLLSICCLFLLCSCSLKRVPENASTYWSMKDGEVFDIGHAKVHFYNQSSEGTVSPSQALYIPFQYERLYFPEGNYLRFRVLEVRNVEVETEETFVYGDEPDKPVVQSYKRYFSVLYAKIESVYYNGNPDIHSFEPGEELFIYTGYAPSIYGEKDEYVYFHEDCVYYGCVGIIKPVETSTDFVAVVQELADYTVDFSSRYVYELRQGDQTVVIPECIWTGEGMEEWDQYHIIHVPVDDFELYYQNNIKKYCFIS